MGTRVLVIGIGNPLRADDGVGVRAVRDLAGQAWPEGVAFHEAGIAAHDLAFRCEGYEALLVLDAVQAGRAPGEWFELGPDDLGGTHQPGLNSHMNFVQALTLAFLDAPMPELHLLGIQPLDAASWREGFSPVLEAAYPAFLDAAKACIMRLAKR
ncbi:MAG: hydrogenase maturation protease [Desulfovibrionaceae bacterium]